MSSDRTPLHRPDPPAADADLAATQGLRFEVVVKARPGARWMPVADHYQELDSAWRLAQLVRDAEVGIFTHDGFMYWSSESPSLFNRSVVVREGWDTVAQVAPGQHHRGHGRSATPLDISTADAGLPTLEWDGRLLAVVFTNWREERVRVQFDDVLTFLWEGVRYLGAGSRDDQAYELHETAFMRSAKTRATQEGTWTKDELDGMRHFSLRFNEGCVLDVVARAWEASR